jgi:hypothetical protein
LPFHNARRNRTSRVPVNLLTYIDSTRLDCESNKSATTSVTRVTFGIREGRVTVLGMRRYAHSLARHFLQSLSAIGSSEKTDSALLRKAGVEKPTSFMGHYSWLKAPRSLHPAKPHAPSILQSPTLLPFRSSPLVAQRRRFPQAVKPDPFKAPPFCKRAPKLRRMWGR